MARSPTKNNSPAAAASVPTKAAAGNPTQDKFRKAFNQVHNKTFASSPRKPATVDVDCETLDPLGTGLVTFSKHARDKHACVCPLLTKLSENMQQVCDTLRIFMQAALFCNETPDGKLKKSPNIDVIGLIITFDHQQDHIKEANTHANLLKVVEALVVCANKLARRPFNGEASETFNCPNEFRVGTDCTRTPPRRRHLGQVVSPADSATCMERIFEGMSFHEIVNDHDIMTAMCGSVEEANKLASTARSEFTPRVGNEDDPNDNDGDEDLPTFVAKP
jgi:hypothetical protein